jgi:hypothetical protein
VILMSMNSIPSSASELANRIAGPARYKFDMLVEGIAAEQRRLVGGPFLALLWVRVFDFEGLTEWLVLGDACPNVLTDERNGCRWLPLQAA